MKEKGDEKFFTNLEKYGNIKPEIQLQLISKKLKFKKYYNFLAKIQLIKRKNKNIQKDKKEVIKRI